MSYNYGTNLRDTADIRELMDKQLDDGYLKSLVKYLDRTYGSEETIKLPSAEKTNALFRDQSRAHGYITRHECMQIIDNLNKRFNDYLVEIGYGLSKKALLSLNGIDMTTLFDSYHEDFIGTGTGLPVLDWNVPCTTNIDTIFDVIPCFEKGYIKLNKNRFLYFELLELKLDETSPSARIKIQDYSTIDIGRRSWMPGTYTILNIDWSKDDDKEKIKPTEFNSFDSIYRNTDYRKLHWSEDEIYLWNKYCTTHAEAFINTSDKETKGLNGAMTLMDYYVYAITIVNDKLKNQTLSRAKRVLSSNTHTGKPVKATTSDNAPKRLIRMLGTSDSEIKIISEKAPKAPSEEYVRHYSVASWTVRGTIRKYKSGKTVYIKEHAAHRHALKNTDQTLTPAVIKVKN